MADGPLPPGVPGTPNMPGPNVGTYDPSTGTDRPPDFRQASRDFHLGADDLGVDVKRSELNRTLAGKIVGDTVALLARNIGGILSWVGKMLEDLEGVASQVFNPFMARLVGHALGADISSDAVAERFDRSGNGGIGNVVAETVFEMLKPPDGQLEPGDAGARRMVGALGHMTVNNWVEGVTLEWLAQYLGWDIDLAALPELAEQLIGNMGLNRLARTALRPLAQIVIATPLEWQLRKQYRPKMLSVPEAIAAWLRGDVDESTVDEIGARDGYGDDAIAALKHAAIKTLSPADAYFLQLAGSFEKQDVIDELRLSGRDAARAELEYNLEELRALHKFELEMVTAAVNAYADRRIDEPKLLELLNADTIDTKTIARFHEIAAQRRLVNVQHLSRADVESAIENEILSIADYTPWLMARGYGHDDALTLELNLQAKLKKLEDARTARAAAAATRAANAAAKLQAQQMKRDQVAAEHAHWTGTLVEAERLVVRGVMPPTLYQQILVDHAIAVDDAAELVTVAVADRDARTAAAAKRAALAAKQKTPAAPIAALEHAVVLGTRSIEDLRAELKARNYPADDVQLLVDLVTREITDRKALQAKRDALAAAATGKQLALGTLEQAVIDGALTVADYNARLTAAKYSPTDVAVLVAVLQQKLKDHTFAVERRALAEQKLEASHVSLANEETAVVDGILTVADFQLWLQAHDFDAGDVAVMTALLEEKLAKKAGA